MTASAEPIRGVGRDSPGSGIESKRSQGGSRSRASPEAELSSRSRSRSRGRLTETASRTSSWRRPRRPAPLADRASGARPAMSRRGGSAEPAATRSFCHSPRQLSVTRVHAHTAGITRPTAEPRPHETRQRGAIGRSPIALEAFEQPTTVGSEALEYPSLSEGRSRMSLSNDPYEGPTQTATITERPDQGIRTCRMTAIVVTDEAAGTAGMTLAERPEPEPAINEVVVAVHASGFTSGELTWPSTWTDRLGRDRTPSIPGQELAGVVTARGYGTTGLSVGQRVFGLTDSYRGGGLAEYVAIEARNLAPLPGDVDFTVGASLPMPGLTAWQGLFEHGRLQAGQSVLVHGAAGSVG